MYVCIYVRMYERICMNVYVCMYMYKRIYIRCSKKKYIIFSIDGFWFTRRRDTDY